MDTKHIYLDQKAIENADKIIDAGFVTSVSAAIRFSLAQVASTMRVQATTP